MVLANGKLDVERLIAGNPAGKKFLKIGVGTNGTAVSETDTALTGMVAKNITSVDYLAGNIVQFNVVLEASDPAMIIREVGLIAEDGTLCYRKVVPAQNKIAGTNYAIAYKIKVQ